MRISVKCFSRYIFKVCFLERCARPAACLCPRSAFGREPGSGRTACATCEHSETTGPTARCCAVAGAPVRMFYAGSRNGSFLGFNKNFGSRRHPTARFLRFVRNRVGSRLALTNFSVKTEKISGKFVGGEFFSYICGVKGTVDSRLFHVPFGGLRVPFGHDEIAANRSQTQFSEGLTGWGAVHKLLTRQLSSCLGWGSCPGRFRLVLGCRNRSDCRAQRRITNEFK